MDTGTGFGHAHGKFHRKQSKQGGELNHRIHGNRRGIFKRIADRISDNRRRMKRRSLFLQFHLNDFLGIIPGSSGIRHKDGLVKPKECNGNQVADEEERLDKSKSQCREKYRHEDIKHPFLCIPGADLHDLFAVAHRSFFNAFEFNVGLNELDRAIGAGADGLS